MSDVPLATMAILVVLTIIGIIGLFMMSAAGGLYIPGYFVFCIPVILSFCVVKRHFDRLDRARH
ncbi:MAG: hypothetical protein ACREF3_09525 [Acetobacteraceae bacterium]